MAKVSIYFTTKALRHKEKLDIELWRDIPHFPGGVPHSSGLNFKFT